MPCDNREAHRPACCAHPDLSGSACRNRASRTGCGLPVGRTEAHPKVGEGVPDEDALDL